MVMVIESASKVIAKSTEHLKGVNFSGRNIRCRINPRIMNFMFCCIDVNYVRNPKQEVNIFGIREKESREVEIFTSASV